MDHLFINGTCAICGAEEETAPGYCIDKFPKDADTAIINAVKLAMLDHGYITNDRPWRDAASIVAAAVVGDLREAKEGRRVTIGSGAGDNGVFLGVNELDSLMAIAADWIRNAPDSGLAISISVDPRLLTIEDVIEHRLEKHLKYARMISDYGYYPSETAKLIASKLKKWKTEGEL